LRALILGAGGMVGQALAAAAPGDAEVAALDRSRCDVTDPAAVREAIAGSGAQIVFNAAAYTAVDRAEAEPEAAEMLNAQAPRLLAQAARAAGARLIHISTDYVFDGSSGRPYRADDTTAPLGVYGRTKRAGEQAVLTEDPGALVVRTAWVFGTASSNFLPAMLRLMQERDRLHIVADQLSTPTYSGSLAAALWSLAANGATGVHHFTDAGTASRYDQAVAIQEEALAIGLLERACSILPIRSVDYPTPAERPYYSVLDKTDTWALTGTPSHWRVNLRTCLRDIARNG
jgi:dTDP-4-dehydrorhamnose reductase